MTTVVVCPACMARWKILPTGDGTLAQRCPLCAPTRELFPLTFDDVCPPSAPTEGDA
jgi:hypothetical protein